MRHFLITAGLLALAVPAAAQPYADPYPDGPEPGAGIARALPSPGQAEAMGRVMGDVMGALMDVDVGPLVDAVDPGGRHHRRERTLGEMAGRGDPYYRERMDRSIDALSLGMGEMAVRMRVLAPALERTLADLGDSIRSATRGLVPDDGHYVPDWDD